MVEHVDVNDLSVFNKDHWFESMVLPASPSSLATVCYLCGDQFNPALTEKQSLKYALSSSQSCGGGALRD